MPKLERSQSHDLCRDMNWSFKYVTEEEVFAEAPSEAARGQEKRHGTLVICSRTSPSR